MEIRLGLRRFQEGDLTPMREWVVDPSIKYNFRFTAQVKSDDDLRKFINGQINRTVKDNFINYVLFDKSDDEKTYLGSVGLKNIDFNDKNAELTIVIGKKNYLGKGYGQDALFLITNYGFNELKLHKIYLTVISHNIRAIKAYEKFGFLHEGIRKDQIFQNSCYFDEILMGLVVDEFKKLYENK